MEILNDCSDVDEIKFQEDGTWCPMRPKKESVKLSSQCLPKMEGEYRQHLWTGSLNVSYPVKFECVISCEGICGCFSVCVCAASQCLGVCM